MRIAALTYCFLLIMILASCKGSRSGGSYAEGDAVDLDSIRSRGELRVAINYNQVNYFEHKGKAMGLQYELALRFANSISTELKVVPQNNVDEALEMLQRGEVDIVATNTFTVPERLSSCLEASESFGQDRIVLLSNEGTERVDSVYVQKDSFFYSELAERIADTMQVVIQSVPFYDVEQLVWLVAEGEVCSALCVESVARANKWYYPQLDISNVIVDYRPTVWQVQKRNKALLEELNGWIRDFRLTNAYKRLERRYVVDARDHKISSKQNVGMDTYQDEYRPIVEKYVEKTPYNTMLIMALIYQESHFNANVQSWAGAKGLMQLMPETGVRFKVKDLSDPEQNIKAGIEFLSWLNSRLQEYVPNHEERIKFSLAAYNVGLGHIMDAIRIARKYGKAPDVWDGSVESCLLMKANPQVVADNQVVKHGFCRGTETVNYVADIMARYANYKKIKIKK